MISNSCITEVVDAGVVRESDRNALLPYKAAAVSLEDPGPVGCQNCDSSQDQLLRSASAPAGLLPVLDLDAMTQEVAEGWITERGREDGRTLWIPKKG